MLQQQLVDLLALTLSVAQTRWTVRGPAAEQVGSKLRATADAVGGLTEATAQHMATFGWLPNGTPLALLIAEVDIRAPDWWPAQEGAALAAAAVAVVQRATAKRSRRLRSVAPGSAELLEEHATVLRRQHVALSSAWR